MMKSLKFGEDASVGCTLSLSREELHRLCSDETHPWLQKLKPEGSTTEIFVPLWLIHDTSEKENFRLHDDYVGIFANADTTEESHWIRINLPHSRSPIHHYKSRLWNHSDSSCSGLITGLSYDINWTFAGSIWNPQAKIMSINVNYQDEITLRHAGWNHTSNDHYEKQNHWFQSSTVTWTFVDSRLDIAHHSPSNFFKIPNDIFYPFHFAGRVSFESLPTSSSPTVRNTYFSNCLYHLSLEVLMVMLPTLLLIVI
jgi:hypothetical protein